jgi:hypothetical protein
MKPRISNELPVHNQNEEAKRKSKPEEGVQPKSEEKAKPKAEEKVVLIAKPIRRSASNIQTLSLPNRKAEKEKQKSNPEEEAQPKLNVEDKTKPAVKKRPISRTVSGDLPPRNRNATETKPETKPESQFEKKVQPTLVSLTPTSIQSTPIQSKRPTNIVIPPSNITISSSSASPAAHFGSETPNVSSSVTKKIEDKKLNEQELKEKEDFLPRVLCQQYEVYRRMFVVREQITQETDNEMKILKNTKAELLKKYQEHENKIHKEFSADRATVELVDAIDKSYRKADDHLKLLLSLKGNDENPTSPINLKIEKQQGIVASKKMLKERFVDPYDIILKNAQSVEKNIQFLSSNKQENMIFMEQKILASAKSLKAALEKTAKKALKEQQVEDESTAIMLTAEEKQKMRVPKAIEANEQLNVLIQKKKKEFEKISENKRPPLTKDFIEARALIEALIELSSFFKPSSSFTPNERLPAPRSIGSLVEEELGSPISPLSFGAYSPCRSSHCFFNREKFDKADGIYISQLNREEVKNELINLNILYELTPRLLAEDGQPRFRRSQSMPSLPQAERLPKTNKTPSPADKKSAAGKLNSGGKLNKRSHSASSLPQTAENLQRAEAATPSSHEQKAGAGKPKTTGGFKAGKIKHSQSILSIASQRSPQVEGPIKMSSPSQSQEGPRNKSLQQGMSPSQS